MGLFDYVDVQDARFVCSEGHPLSGSEFQTKDLGCTMGRGSIADGRFDLKDGGYRTPPDRPLSDTIDIYTDCHKCPAFVQDKTCNVVSCWVGFDVEIREDVAVRVTRNSEDTAAFLRSVQAGTWMRGCIGPMPYGEAQAIRDDYLRRWWSSRP